MAAKGASLEDCLIVEIFAGSSRATAALKQLGLKSSFGVDKARSKNAMSTVVIADLTTPEGEELLMSWLNMPNVVGIFLAPPCGSASRARQIPLTRKFGSKRNGPRPLRTDQFPNGIPKSESFRTESNFSGKSAVSCNCEVSQVGLLNLDVFLL